MALAFRRAAGKSEILVSVINVYAQQTRPDERAFNIGPTADSRLQVASAVDVSCCQAAFLKLLHALAFHLAN
jgi:hypothetical protein